MPDNDIVYVMGQLWISITFAMVFVILFYGALAFIISSSNFSIVDAKIIGFDQDIIQGQERQFVIVSLQTDDRISFLKPGTIVKYPVENLDAEVLDSENIKFIRYAQDDEIKILEASRD